MPLNAHFSQSILAILPLWFALACGVSGGHVHAGQVVWACSRSEPEPEAFVGIRAFRIENLSARDDSRINITLSDLYSAYAGETVRMGKHQLSACTLAPKEPLQVEAMGLLGFDPQEVSRAAQQRSSRLVIVPSIHQMQKCIAENHPAVGFFRDVVENDRIRPCF